MIANIGSIAIMLSMVKKEWASARSGVILVSLTNTFVITVCDHRSCSTGYTRQHLSSPLSRRR